MDLFLSLWCCGAGGRLFPPPKESHPTRRGLQPVPPSDADAAAAAAELAHCGRQRALIALLRAIHLPTPAADASSSSSWAAAAAAPQPPQNDAAAAAAAPHNANANANAAITALYARRLPFHQLVAAPWEVT